MSSESSTNVMIVDDEEMVVGSIQSILELETDYRVLPFTSPQAALTSLPEQPVHAILADFMMPEIDGVTFLTQARGIAPMATRLLLTGYADKQNAIRAINDAGLYQYLEKPWDNDALMLVLRNAVERSRLFHELGERVAELEHANQELTGFKERVMQAFM